MTPSVSSKMTGTSADNMPCASANSGHAGIEELVHRLDHDRALADDGGDALDRSRADIADREDAGPGRRVRRGQRHAVRILAGSDEALGVEIEATIEPIGVGLGPDHHEHVAVC